MGFESRSRKSFLQRWVLILLLICLDALEPSVANAAKQSERIYNAPDSHVAGFLNTEVVPESGFQADLTTGHLWYGAGENSSIFTNAILDSAVLIARPTLSLGGKERYCDSGLLSCSLLIEVALGGKFVGSRTRFFGALFQNSLAFDFESSGRLIWGLGGAVFSSREFNNSFDGYSDQFISWTNLAYDIPLSSSWSIGVGMSPSLKGLNQEHINNELIVERMTFASSNLFHLRTQFSFSDWVLSAGGALLSLSSNWSMWPIVEVHYRSPSRD